MEILKAIWAGYRAEVALLLDVVQGLLLHLEVLMMLLIRFAQFEAEIVLGRGLDLCKEGTRERPTRVLLALQSTELSTLSAQQLIKFAHCDVITRHIRVTVVGRDHSLLYEQGA
jgi:hypothetical protein